jgi:hypothetical protein
MALKDNLIDLSKGWPEGFTPIDNPPATETATPVLSSSRMRTPLPATNADADLINQTEAGGQSLSFRMMPLPPPQGSVTVTTGGSGGTGSSSSGSGGSSTPAVLNPTTVTLSIPFLDGSSLARLAVLMSQSFQLLSIASNNPVNVRLYGNISAQVLDVSRPPDAPVPAEVGQNIIIDVILDTNPFIWYSQNICGANQSSPQTPTIYVTAINPSSVPISGTNISITFVQLEN